MGQSTQKLRDLKSRDFVTVQEAKDLEQYDSRHTKKPELYVVVVDAEGTPETLTTSGDIALGFPPEDLFLADEEIPIFHLQELRPVLKEQGFSAIGVMRDQEMVGVVRLQDVPQAPKYSETMPVALRENFTAAHYRCRRYPRCTYEKTVPLVDAPPLCPVSSAHGHMVLVG